MGESTIPPLMGDLANSVARLKSQVSRAEPILFIGAGFSLEARSSDGQYMPSSADLAREFWNEAFPSQPFDSSTHLGDAFYAAKTQNPRGLSGLINRRLTIDSQTLPEHYAQWFSVPWARCYSLNIDDLELAVARRYHISRGISSVSATSGAIQGDTRAGSLEVVHLNGAVGDELDDLTFSAVDYGARLAIPDQWLIRCLTDILARPVVFVGTELDESTLWQHLQYRKSRGDRGTRELRPGSILVCPHVNPARQILLRELHVDWVQGIGSGFAQQVLSQLGPSINEGREALTLKLNSDTRAASPKLVSELASVNPTRKTDYLIGQEPDWADLHQGRAIVRDIDVEILNRANFILSSAEPESPLVLTGTAASGKSTSLMRLGLELSAQGIPTYWIDESSNLEVHRVRDLVRDAQDPVAILVDDSDLFGRTTSAWAREIPRIRPKVLMGFAVRSSKVDGLLDAETLGGIEPYEINMPHLTDSDIDGLIRVLAEENRLGILRNRSHEERVAAFRKEAGRQLLVAMYQATSGGRFAEKAVEEYTDLPETQHRLYGTVCFVSSQRYTLSLDEVLAAAGGGTNQLLNDIERMVSRGILIRTDKYTGYGSRHRFLAEQVVGSQAFRSQIRPILEGVYFALATHLRPDQPRSSRQWRRWIWFIRHEFFLNFASPQDGRDIYRSLETLLDWDYHYWLQRGSLEVEYGELGLATNFLGQARSLAPEDGFVATEWAYLLMKKAATLPGHIQARDWFSEGYSILNTQTEDRGRHDPHPFHVLGSQTLAWVRSKQLPILEKRRLLEETRDIVNVGRQRHRRSQELDQLSQHLQHEWLMTAVEV